MCQRSVVRLFFPRNCPIPPCSGCGGRWRSMRPVKMASFHSRWPKPGLGVANVSQICWKPGSQPIQMNPIRRHFATAILGESTPVQAGCGLCQPLCSTAMLRDLTRAWPSFIIVVRNLLPKLLPPGVEPAEGRGNVLGRWMWHGTGRRITSAPRHGSSLASISLQNMLQESAKRDLYDELAREDMTAFHAVASGRIQSDRRSRCTHLLWRAGWILRSLPRAVWFRAVYVIVVHEAIEDVPPRSVTA